MGVGSLVVSRIRNLGHNTKVCCPDIAFRATLITLQALCAPGTQAWGCVEGRKCPGTRPAPAPWADGAQPSQVALHRPWFPEAPWLLLCPSPSWPEVQSLSPSKFCGVLTLPSVRPLKSRFDVSCVCLATPLHGLVGASLVPFLLSGGLSLPAAKSSGRHRNGLAVHFRTTTLY